MTDTATAATTATDRPVLAAFHHAALTVGDVETSAAWYAEVLGLCEVFREQREGRRAVIMRFPAGGYSVALVEHTGADAGIGGRRRQRSSTTSASAMRRSSR